jgi:hypothetical protein
MPRIERPAPAIGPVRHEQCHQNHPTMAAVKAVGIGRALQQWRWSEEQLPQKHILLLACRREGDMIIENRIRSRIELKTKFAQGKVVVLAPGINHGIDETFWEAWWVEFGDSLAAEHLKVITPHIRPPLIPSPSRRRRRRHRTSSALVLSMPNNATLRRIVLGRLAMFGLPRRFSLLVLCLSDYTTILNRRPPRGCACRCGACSNLPIKVCTIANVIRAASNAIAALNLRRHHCSRRSRLST